MGKILSRQPLIGESCRLVQSECGCYTEVGDFNYFENVVFGDFSYTGRFCFLQNVEVGKFANIAAMVRIGPTDHPMERPTQHHFTYRRVMYGLDDKDDEAFLAWRAAQTTFIGHDTWLGHGAIVMPRVTVGNGAVIGSGTIVTKDVAPYTIVVGVPGKALRKRFSEEIIAQLEAIAWWDWSYEDIKARLEDFSLPADEFCRRYAR